MDGPDYEQILRQIAVEVEPLTGSGEVACYIPELANVSPDRFGMSLQFVDGRYFEVAESNRRFSIQSISKVFSTAAAFALVGDALWQRVHVEPAGTPFNSLVQLELENGIPRNPFLNSGALVVTDVLLSNLSDPYGQILSLMREMCGAEIEYNPKVVASELRNRGRNAALAHLLQSFGNLHNDVEAVLDLYTHYCSLEMSCRELAGAFQYFARKGRVESDIPDLTTSHIKRLNALMQTCGFYDEAGEFSFKVGLPGKSGVGGGIAAVYPEFYSVAVWSPRLNAKGNSVKGMKALELLTSISGLSIF